MPLFPRLFTSELFWWRLHFDTSVNNMAATGENWSAFFEKTPKPPNFDEILETVRSFIDAKRKAGMKVVLVSVSRVRQITTAIC